MTDPDAGRSPDPLSTSLSLLQQIKQHDEAGWERFVNTYGPLVYFWCRQDGGLQSVDATDVTQEVFQIVAANIDQFQERSGSGSFRGWLRTITRHACRDYWRRRSKQIPGRGGTEGIQWMLGLENHHAETDEAPLDEKALVVGEALNVVRNDFQEHVWQAFWQTTVEQLSTSQVADNLAMSHAAVRQARRRVRQRVQEQIAEMVEWSSGTN